MSQKILIAADTPFMRLTIKNILANHGYLDVVQVDNCHDAVDAYADHAPDLVLLDAGLRVLDGIAATRNIKASHPDARIALCASSRRKNMVVDAIQAGANELIARPLSPERVIESVCRLIGHAEGVADSQPKAA